MKVICVTFVTRNAFNNCSPVRNKVAFSKVKMSVTQSVHSTLSSVVMHWQRCCSLRRILLQSARQEFLLAENSQQQLPAGTALSHLRNTRACVGGRALCLCATLSPALPFTLARTRI